MRKLALASCVAALVAAGSANAEQGPFPSGIPRLDHVFVIMMENHAYGQIAGQSAGALHQFADGQGESRDELLRHRASELHQLSRGRRRLELQQAVGSISRLAQRELHAEHRAGPGDQHRQPELRRRSARLPASNGTDAATPVLDNSTNETSAPPLTNINGTLSIPAEHEIDGISIADQLVARASPGSPTRRACPSSAPTASTSATATTSIGGNNAAGSQCDLGFCCALDQPATRSALRTSSTSTP